VTRRPLIVLEWARDGLVGREVRPTHRVERKPRRDWRTQKDPFENVWPQVQAWLEDEPDRTAKELFQRLQASGPGVRPDGQLRTFQRRLKEWRRAEARRLVFGAHDDGTLGMGGGSTTSSAGNGAILMRTSSTIPS
jgi:hypothetical protein